MTVQERIQTMQANGAKLILLANANGRAWTLRTMDQRGNLSDNMHLLMEEIPFVWATYAEGIAWTASQALTIDQVAQSVWELVD